MMKRLLSATDEFLQASDWKDIAILKICLLSLGLLAGMRITDRHKKGVELAACTAFVLTYIPLMTRFLKIFTKATPVNNDTV